MRRRRQYEQQPKRREHGKAAGGDDERHQVHEAVAGDVVDRGKRVLHDPQDRLAHRVSAVAGEPTAERLARSACALQGERRDDEPCGRRSRDDPAHPSLAADREDGPESKVDECGVLLDAEGDGGRYSQEPEPTLECAQHAQHEKDGDEGRRAKLPQVEARHEGAGDPEQGGSCRERGSGAGCSRERVERWPDSSQRCGLHHEECRHPAPSQYSGVIRTSPGWKWSAEHRLRHDRRERVVTVREQPEILVVECGVEPRHERSLRRDGFRREHGDVGRTQRTRRRRSGVPDPPGGGHALVTARGPGSHPGRDR